MAELRKKLQNNRIKFGIYAFYHPFYGTPSGPTGAWRGWNSPTELGVGAGYPEAKLPKECAEAIRPYLTRNPETEIGPGRPDTYSAYVPQIGLYDSRDPKVLKRQILSAVEASLDGFVWDWLGENHPERSHPDICLKAALATLQNLDVPFRIVLFYDGFMWNNLSPQRIADELTYLRKTYAGHPHIAHLEGRLVVFIYATFVKHTPAQWKEVRLLLAERGANDVALIAGEPSASAQLDLFEGVQTYSAGLVEREGMRRRYQHLAHLAREQDLFLALPAVPGFNGTRWHLPGRAIARRHGQFLRETWQEAMACNPDWLLICSWNEWGEGTQIEPDTENLDYYLSLTRELAQEARASRKRSQ